MKAVVLAAGLGTRLGALTADTPKAAVLVGGRPIVAHVVAHLARCGYTDLAVNLHYRGDQVRAAVEEAAGELNVAWFPEEQLLGTAGALVPMGPFLAGPDPFLVQYGDVLTDHDLGGLLDRQRARDALLTMLVHRRTGSNSLVEIAEDGRVRDFLERPTPEERRGRTSEWVNSGIYACSPSLWELVPPPPSDLARDVVPLALRDGTVLAERLEGYRCAIDSPARVQEAQQALVEGRWRSALVGAPEGLQ